MDRSHHVLRRCDVDDFTPALCDRLRAIYRDAVLQSGPQHYDAAQVAAWAETADDVRAWSRWIAEGNTWIAVAAGRPDHAVAVAMRWPADHLHLLYVDPSVQRRGIATALLGAIDEEARAEGVEALTTDASLVSHPVFLRCGYQVVEWEAAERRGQVFRRARMRKLLR